jgi:hypothetical protein
MARDHIETFQAIPNVGPAIERRFIALGVKTPRDLVGKDPYQLYSDLCRITNTRQDPCLLDVFISAVRYMEGGPARKWWEFTAERKRHLGERHLGG